MMKRVLLSVAFSLGLAAAGTGAQAATCMLNGISPTAQACVVKGGNEVNGSGGAIAEQKDALATLGFNWDGTNWNQFEKLDVSGNSVNFATQLYGITYVAFHFGNASSVGNSTVFYRFDAGEGAGLDTLGINDKALSNAIVYSTGVAPPTGAVPEPATWAMMILGFGGIGALIRRRRAAAAFA